MTGTQEAIIATNLRATGSKGARTGKHRSWESTAVENGIRITRVEAEDQLARVRELMTEYADSLDFDLSFQDFHRELESLPGQYAAPTGLILLATIGSQPAGCVALRQLGRGTCEMKRLYVRPGFRGKGIGKALALAILEEARLLGYSRMRLDTVPSMAEAIRLYRSLGFREIPPYRYNPIQGALFMELVLARHKQPDRAATNAESGARQSP